MSFEQVVHVLDGIKHKLMPAVDVKTQHLGSGEKEIQMLYLSSACDEAKLQKEIIAPFFKTKTIGAYESYLTSLPAYTEYTDEDEFIDQLIHGSVGIASSGHIYVLDIRNVVNKDVAEATVETTIQGPQLGLSESIATNINLLRSRYHQPTLRIEQYTIGELGKQDIVIVYDEQLVLQHVLQQIRDGILATKEDIVQSTGQLHRILTPSKRRLFPKALMTERPDRIVLNLSQGKVAVMIEGSPFSIVAPAVFYDFMSSMEDLYQSYWVAKFLIILRYTGLFISILLPSAYVALTSYNPEIFRVQLALSIAGSRVGVPYPSYLEVLFMLFMMELLTEASVRLPKSIGSTATTVGGLILGQAATEAALVSNIMIIIVSAVAISNFVIPINEMSFSMRVVKYMLLMLTTFAGLIGLVCGFILLLYYLVQYESFGEPYLKLFIREQPIPKK